MKRHSFLMIILFFSLFFPLAVFAGITSLNNEKDSFDIEQANNRFEVIYLQLLNEKLNVKTLNHAIVELEAFLPEAEQCVENASTKLGEINSQIKKFAIDSKASKGVDIKYLEDQKRQLTNRMAQCRLFTIRAEEVLNEYRSTSLSLQQEITFTRGETIVSRIQQLPADWERLSLPEVNEKETWSTIWCALYLLLLLFIAGLLGVQLHRMLDKKWYQKPYSIVFNTILIFGFLFFFGYFLLVAPSFKAGVDNALFRDIFLDASMFFIVLFSYNSLFLLRRIPSLLHWYGFDVPFLKRVGLAIISIYFLRTVGLDLLALYQSSPNILQFYETFILIVSLSTMLYFALIFYHIHRVWLERHIKGGVVYRLIVLATFALLALDFVGYSILAVNTAHILMALLLVSALGFLLLRGINKIYQIICYTYPARKYLKKYLGYASEPPFLEILLLKLMTQLGVIIGLCYMFARLIGEASYFLDYVLEYFVYGFPVSGFIVIPLQWLFGLFIFCLFVLLSRHIATRISRSQQFEDEEETQVAFASIVLYVGFAISVIMGLLMAGFSFTSLAIIAGALSLGIGLGLQSIVNNFFSGLILLIEKPIKAGDRIKIDNVEGFVKKVRVRSTQLQTPAQEDIIIPNSDLITHQVTNYMFSDTYWRVQCSVGVAYGSNTGLVKELMMSVALAHPEVVKEKGKEPIVLFRSFGDSALIFEMWCLIKDVNQKYLVASDLNFAIDMAFREHDITIAFPQRDVNLKIKEGSFSLKNDKEDKG